uniref:Uncharacterized protein n=1 Tax=Oryza barthii TaxID=65489 RepID=A0A0D3EJI5_9ORYZ
MFAFHLQLQQLTKPPQLPTERIEQLRIRREIEYNGGTATGVGVARREPEAKIASALGAFGVAAISTATTLATAAFEPPPGGLRTTTYNHLAVAGTFLGGVALVGASVWVSDNPAARRGTGKKLLYAAVPTLLAAVVLSVAVLLW